MFGSQGFAEAPFAGPARTTTQSSGGGTVTPPGSYELIVNPTSYTSTPAAATMVISRQLRVSPITYSTTFAATSLVITTATTTPVVVIPPTPVDKQRLQVGTFFFKWNATDNRWAADGSTPSTNPVLPTPTIIFKNIADHLNVIDNAVGRMFMAPINELIAIAENIRSQVSYRLGDTLTLSETIAHDGPSLSANFKTMAEPWIFQPLQGTRPVDVLAFKEVVQYLAQMQFADQALIADAITIIGRWQKDDGFGVGESQSSQLFEPPPVSAGTTADSTTMAEGRTMDATMAQTELLANLLDSQAVSGNVTQADTLTGFAETQTTRGLVSANDSSGTINESQVIYAVFAAAEQFAIADLAKATGGVPYAESITLADAQSNGSSSNGVGDSFGMVDNTSITGQMSQGDFVSFSESTGAQGVYFKNETLGVADALMMQALLPQTDATAISESWSHDGATLSSNFTTGTSGGAPAPLLDPNTSASRSTSDTTPLGDTQPTIAGTFQGADATPLAETQSLSASMVASDNPLIVDGYNSQATLSGSDTISLDESITPSGTYPSADALALAESNSVQASNISGDSTPLAETVSYSGNTAGADSTTLADARSMSGSFLKTDTITFADGFSVQATYLKAETITPAETRAILGRMTFADAQSTPTESISNQVVSSGPALKQTSNQMRTSTAATAVATFSTAVTAGSTLIVMFAVYDTNVTSVVGSRNGAFVQIGYAEDTNYNSMEVWAKYNCAAGTETVTITLANPSGGYLSGIGIEVSGVTAMDKGGINYNSYTVTANGANATANSFVISGAVHDDGGNAGWGTPSGYTLLNRENDADNYTASQWSYKIVSAIETSSATVTSTSAATVVDSMIITLKP